VSGGTHEIRARFDWTRRGAAHESLKPSIPFFNSNSSSRWPHLLGSAPPRRETGIETHGSDRRVAMGESPHASSPLPLTRPPLPFLPLLQSLALPQNTYTASVRTVRPSFLAWSFLGSRQWSFACLTASFFTPKIWGGYVCS
jgi:hypothetical protein